MNTVKRGRMGELKAIKFSLKQEMSGSGTGSIDTQDDILESNHFSNLFNKQEVTTKKT